MSWVPIARITSVMDLDMKLGSASTRRRYCSATDCLKFASLVDDEDDDDEDIAPPLDDSVIANDSHGCCLLIR